MTRVLAIGIDAADATTVRRLADGGELPNLRDIGAAGSWQDLQGAGDLGVAAVWPTFVTGTSVQEHGTYCDLLWEPERMQLGRWRPSRPFWAGLDNGLRAGAFDVPTSAPTGELSAFELYEWGPHVRLLDGTAVAPEGIEEIVSAHEPHPFAARAALLPGPRDNKGIAQLGADCVEGIHRRASLARSLIAERRPDFAVMVFPEVHEAGHAYWHTFDPDNPLYADLPSRSIPAETGIDALLREIDTEVGRLVEAMGPDTAVAVFSLHGMGPGRGRPTFLPPVLVERGWASAPHGPRGAGALARSVLGRMRRRAPQGVRSVYHSLVPQSAMWRVASVTQSPAHDWSRTRAFALPGDDQHGWVRINLRGRERDGIVSPQDYEPMRDELAAELAALEDVDGRPLVDRVLRRADDAGAPSRLPDLTVHWADAALARTVRVAGTSVETAPASLEYTGNHVGRLYGFCVSRGLPTGSDPMRVEELSGLLAAAATG
jgi:predicted AlkP superfamily phosphohydrolase/phosphomutase